MSNIKEQNIEFENYFEELLKEKYPKNTVIRNHRIEPFTPDFSIIDEKTTDILAIIELKKIKKDITQSQLAGFNSHIQRISRILEKDIPFYYVSSSDQGKGYEVYKLIKENSEFEFESTDLPSYSSLKNQDFSNRIKEYKKDRKKSLEGLKISSWLCSLMILIVFAFFKWKEIELSNVDGLLILSAGFFAVFPYIKKVSYKDFSIERYIEQIEKTDEDTK